MQDTDSSSIEECPSCGTPVDASEVEPLSRVACPVCGSQMIVGRYISHYELIEEVGRGGMGVVYKALDTSLGRNVALKILRKDHSENEELVSQLATEAAITASINHPHVVRVFSTGTFEGRFYIAMELVDKGTLDDLITLQGSVAEAQVLEVAIQISQGLRAAYQHGLIHRDVKPGNILFADSHTAKIVDFGLATIEQAGTASTGEIWGTPYYVAPEKLDHKPEDFRSDMYSLGATLFHALAGRPPFEAADATLVALKHLKSEAVSLQAFAPHVSGSTAYVINRTLSKDPDKRYQSYDEFIEHLEYARREFGEQASQPKAKQRMVLETEQDQKLWSYVTFGMLGLLLLVGAGAWWFIQKGGKNGARTEPAAVVAKGAAQKSPQGKTYEAARATLIKGDFKEAAKRFHGIAVDAKAPEPLRHWSYAHEGLAHLFAGELDAARASFEALRDLGAPVGEGASLAKFFASLADKARSPGVVPASAMRDFDRQNYGALAILVLGMKNWELGEFDEAATWIRQFHSAQPAAPFTWISEYKPLISNYLADLTEYRGVMEMVKAADDPTSTQAAIDALTRTRDGLNNKGKLSAKLDGVISELRSRPGSIPEVKLQPASIGKSTLDSAKAIELATKWQFADARKEISESDVMTPALVGQRDLFAMKLGWLEDAKNALIAMVPAANRSLPLTRKDGSTLGGAVSKATQYGVEITGAASVSWQDLAPARLVNILAAAGSADRLWSAGILAAWLGDADAASKYLKAAAIGNREYLDALSGVWPGFQASAENFALGKTARATHSTTPAESADKILDGKLDTSWSSDRAGVKAVQIDLGTPHVINRWVVKHARSGGAPAEANAVSYSLEASTDGKAWAELDSVKGNAADATNRTISPTQARYFRLSVHEPSFRNYSISAKIPELELYGGTIDIAARAVFLRTDASPIVPSFDTMGIDLADPRQLGETRFNPTTTEWDVKSASRDIWDKADSFVFLYQPLTGDGEIVARMASIEAVDPFTKLGVMVREALTPSARYAMLCLTASNGFSLQQRSIPGSLSTSVKQPGSVPGWVKIVRTGNTFTGFVSADGRSWQQVGTPDMLEMPAQIFVGIAATSHHVETKAAFQFANARITGKKPDKASADAN